MSPETPKDIQEMRMGAVKKPTSALAANALNNVHGFTTIDDTTMEEILELVRKPFKAIGSVCSHGQVKDLCKQLTIKNLALQKERLNAKLEIARLRKGEL